MLQITNRKPLAILNLVAHDCGGYAADFLDFIAFCRCSTGVALHPLKNFGVAPPPPCAGRCRTEIWVWKGVALHGGVAATVAGVALHCATKISNRGAQIAKNFPQIAAPGSSHRTFKSRDLWFEPCSNQIAVRITMPTSYTTSQNNELFLRRFTLPQIALGVISPQLPGEIFRATLVILVNFSRFLPRLQSILVNFNGCFPRSQSVWVNFSQFQSVLVNFSQF